MSSHECRKQEFGKNIVLVDMGSKHKLTSPGLIFLTLVSLCSCTVEIPFEVEGTGKQLVVNSVFNIQEPFKFYFFTTETPTQASVDFQDKLHFMLYENDVVMLDTNMFSNELLTTIIPRTNCSYRLEVSSEDYPTVLATDTIPRLVKIEKAMILIPAGVDEYGDVIAEAQISFSDPAGEENYYELLLYSMMKGEPSIYWHPGGDSKTIDPVLIDEGDMDYFPSSYFFSDKLFDGQEYTMRIRSTGGGTGQKYGVTLRSVSRSYFFYRKYYTRHANNQQFQGDFLDLIFMGEPQNMYTNIENGYGIFVGFQETSSTLEEK